MKARWLRLLWALTRKRTFSPLSVAKLMVIAVIDESQSAFMQIRTNVHFNQIDAMWVDDPRCGTPWQGGDGNDGRNRHRPVARSPASRADAAAGDVGTPASCDQPDRVGACPRAHPLRGRDRARVLQRVP